MILLGKDVININTNTVLISVQDHSKELQASSIYFHTTRSRKFEPS